MNQLCLDSLPRRAFLRRLATGVLAASATGVRLSAGAPASGPGRRSLAFPAPADFARLGGFNFKPTILMQTQNLPGRIERGPFSCGVGQAPEEIRRLAALGFNLLRVGMSWESWEKDRAAFLGEATQVAQAAQDAGMYVFFSTLHAYGVSSWFEQKAKASGPWVPGDVWHPGFPYSVMEGYLKTVPGADRRDQPRFWEAWLARQVRTRDGADGWDYQVRYLVDLAENLDRYSSVIGYEILNEPGVDGSPRRNRNLGRYHTYVARALRAHTRRYVFFDRCYQKGTDGRSYEAWLDELWPEGVERVAFAPHRYGADSDIQLFAQVGRKHGAPVVIGEWGYTTPAPVADYLRRFQDAGVAWTFYAYMPSGAGNAYVAPDRAPNAKMREILQARAAVYGTPSHGPSGKGILGTDPSGETWGPS